MDLELLSSNIRKIYKHLFFIITMKTTKFGERDLPVTADDVWTGLIIKYAGFDPRSHPQNVAEAQELIKIPTQYSPRTLDELKADVKGYNDIYAPVCREILEHGTYCPTESFLILLQDSMNPGKLINPNLQRIVYIRNNECLGSEVDSFFQKITRECILEDYPKIPVQDAELPVQRQARKNLLSFLKNFQKKII